MAAVLMVYAARALISAAAMKLYVLAVCIAALASLASIPSVLANLEHVGIAGFATFFFVAFVKTGIIVRLAVIVGAAALLSFLADVIRRIPRPQTLAI